MLFALLLGMAMNFLSADGACTPGIEFTARQVLRIGVALLGLRITRRRRSPRWAGSRSRWSCVSVALTIGVSMLVAPAAGLPDACSAC